jgi:hypothetical protein
MMYFYYFALQDYLDFTRGWGGGQNNTFVGFTTHGELNLQIGKRSWFPRCIWITSEFREMQTRETNIPLATISNSTMVTLSKLSLMR